MKKLPQWLLHELFDYSDDGNLIWRVRVNSKVPAGSVAGKQHPAGYIMVGYRGKSYGLHRLVYAWHKGDWPPLVDHEDQDPSNNRIDNLRPLSDSANHINSNKTWNKIGMKGVYKAHRSDKWVARIGVNGKSVRLGRYTSPEEAHAAYLKAKWEFYPDV